jgi:ATP-binding cassette subfamily B protein
VTRIVTSLPRAWVVLVLGVIAWTGWDTVSVRGTSMAEPEVSDRATLLVGLVALLMLGLGLLVLRKLRQDPERPELRETTSTRGRTRRLKRSESARRSDAATVPKTTLDVLEPTKTNQLRLLRYARPYWKSILLLLGTMGMGVVLGLLAPWPMKLLVDNVLGEHPLPEPLQEVVDILPGDGKQGLLLWVVAGSVALFIVATAVGMLSTVVSTRVGQQMAYNLGADLFLHVQRLSIVFHSRRPVGDTIARVTGDPYCVQVMALGALLPLVQSVVTLVAMFFVMWQLQPTLTLLSLGIVPFLVLAIRVYSRPMKDTSRVTRDLEGAMMSVVQRTLTAVPAVQAFTREEHEHERFRAYARDTVKAYVRSTRAGLWFKLFVGLVTTGGTAAMMYLGASYVLDGELTLGTLLVFLAYLASLYGPLNSITYTASTWQQAAAEADRVLEILEAVPEVQDKPDAREILVRGGVRYDEVTFGYEPGRPVLKRVSLEARPGDVLAIVGPTGAGKSTLVNLLIRFFDPWSGHVLVDGQDVRDLRVRSLREQVAIVLQDPFIFPLTIEENIGYGRPDATHDEIVAAAQAANAHEFIARLPDGYATLVGERGATLSGGEKQRLSIARAFLKDAPILILDEPTSALDARTEGMLLDALERLMEGRLTFIIAHRLSTIRRADMILVLDHGEIVEQGTHVELLARGGLYASLYRQQMEFARHDASQEVASA